MNRHTVSRLASVLQGARQMSVPALNRNTQVRPEVWVVAITLLAAFFRFYRLTDFPPALYLDEAWDAYDALRVLRTGSLFPYFGGSYGREPLMIHLQALAFLLFGANAWALRLVPAIVGVLTVPAIYRAAIELFHGSKRGKWLGVLAATILAVSFWHVDVSRLSPRVIFVPLFGIPAVWAFWRGWNNHRRRYFVWAGLLIGVSLYTYPAARFIPVLLIAFAVGVVLVQWLWKKTPPVALRRAVVEMAVMLLVMGAVFAPLALFYLQNPGAFFVRPSDTLIFSSKPDEATVSLGENISRVVRLFIDHGDMNWRHNLPGRPAFDLLEAIGFWVGLVVAITRLPSAPAYLLLLMWLGLNLAPTAVTTDAPHFLRAIYALPAACILAADGLALVWERLVPRLGWAPLLLVVAALGSVLTYNDYFNVWGPHRETYYAFDGSIDAVVERVMSESQKTDVILPMNIYGTPQMQLAIAKRYPGAVPWLAQKSPSAALVITGPVQRMNVVLGPQGVYIPEPFDDQEVAELKALLRNAEKVKTRFGDEVATAVWLDDDAEFTRGPKPVQPLEANFGNQVRLFGYSFDHTSVAPGDKLRITLYWQAMQELNSDYIVSVNLLDPHGESFAQRVSEPALGAASTSLWRQGMVVPDNFDITIPEDAHEGTYRIEVSLLDRKKADLLLPLVGAQDRLVLDSIMVQRSPVSPAAIAHPLAASLGEPPLIALIGYDIAPIKAGGNLSLALYWQGESAIPIDYSVFIHLTDANGTMLAQQDGAPQNGNAPTIWWRPGQLIKDVHTLPIPAGLEGKYQIELGVYDSATGQRLPVFDADGRRQPNDHWLLPVEITGQ